MPLVNVSVNGDPLAHQRERKSHLRRRLRKKAHGAEAESVNVSDHDVGK